MVIEYKKNKNTVSNVYTVGVFEAHKNLNKLLRSAEPANHWGWISNSKRLKDLKEYEKLNISIEYAENVIKSIYRKIRDVEKEFQLKLTPDTTITSSNFRNLDVLLTRFFGKGKKKGGGGGGAPRNIRIHHKKTIPIFEEKTNKRYYECLVDVSLDQNCKKNTSLVYLNHKINIQGDDNAQTVIETYESDLAETDALISKEIDGKNFYEISKISSFFKFKTKSVDNLYHANIDLDYSEIEVEN